MPKPGSWWKHALDHMADKLFVVACVRGNLEEIETLVAAGADVNAVDANGATACHVSKPWALW